MTFSSFDSCPGLTNWHSRDLVNWQPRKAALTSNIGSVWAVSLEKQKRPVLSVHSGRGDAERDPRHMVRPDRPRSANHIDPCHAVGDDGSRWLFLSGGDRPHGDRRTITLDPRPLDERPRQLSRAHRQHRRKMVGAGPCLPRRSARRQRVVGLSRLRQWVLDARPTDAPRSDPLDRRWLVRDDRERSFEASGHATRRYTLPHGQPLSDDVRTLRIGNKCNFFRPRPAERDRARTEGGA